MEKGWEGREGGGMPGVGNNGSRGKGGDVVREEWEAVSL